MALRQRERVEEFADGCNMVNGDGWKKILFSLDGRQKGTEPIK